MNGRHHLIDHKSRAQLRRGTPRRDRREDGPPFGRAILPAACALASTLSALLLASCGNSTQQGQPLASMADAAEIADAKTDTALADAPAHSDLLPDLSPQAQQALESASQLIVAVTPAWTDSEATLALFARSGGGWTMQLGPFDAEVGYKGLSWGRGLSSPPPGATRVKVEGDKTAPAGLFRLGSVMGYGPQPPDGLKLPYRQATADTICVDDPASAHYNTIVEATSGVPQDWTSHEDMLRPDNLYSLLALIDHNGLAEDATPVKGGGSCIFMHLWSGPGSPTIGCTALDGAALSGVLLALESLDHVVLVQLPAPEYGEAQLLWHLPSMSPR